MSPLPAGPRFAPLQTVRFVRDPTGLFRDCLRRFGDPCTVPTLLGTMFVTASPDGIRDVFSADPDAFAPFGAGPRGPVLGEGSLLLLSGARHRRERKLLTPAFHGERMRAYGRLMQATTLAHAGRLAERREIVIQDMTQAITLELIVRAVFGVDEPERVARFHEAITATVDAVSPAILFFGAVQRPIFPSWRRFRARKDALDALMLEQIERRRAAPGEDVLSLMLAARDEDGLPMSDSELRDELVTMIIAGHETTAISLAWAMAYLHRDRRVLDRLLAEIDSLGPDPEPEAVARSPYLGAVCDETLRLRPPTASAVPRLVRTPIRLCGHDIPPGTLVIAAITAAHLDPALYPSPETFRPERFLDRKYTPFEYLPFGGGARRCLGAAFASYEMRLVLATLLAKHRFSSLSSALPRSVRRNVTFGPEDGVPLRHEGPRPPPTREPAAA